MKIEARGISYKYEYSDKTVLSDVDFSVSSSEKIALLGANGCGKTTLLKILCGLYAPNKGQILIDDKLIKPSPSFGFLVGLVPENPEEMFFESTVQREIEFILTKKNDSEIVEKVKNIMVEFDLYKLKDHSPFDISSGEKRKLSIAAMVVAEQPFIFLDEPISGLDLNGIRIVENWINRANRGIIATTHRTDFAQLFDRVVLMNDGHILSSNASLDKESLERANVMMLRREI